MKLKRTKTHLVFKMSRTEYDKLCCILDLGLQDVESPSSYDRDADFAWLFMNSPTEPEDEPKFHPVQNYKRGAA
jgi:hypothetical protein